MSTILVIFVLVFVLGPIAKAYAERMNRGLPPDARKALTDVERLRHEVEQLSTQVARLHEEQSFMLRLLSDGERRMLERGEMKDRAPGAEPEGRATDSR